MKFLLYIIKSNENVVIHTVITRLRRNNKGNVSNLKQRFIYWDLIEFVVCHIIYKWDKISWKCKEK